MMGLVLERKTSPFLAIYPIYPFLTLHSPLSILILVSNPAVRADMAS